MSIVHQLRMHAVATDTHIPRPLLTRAADQIEELAEALQNTLGMGDPFERGETFMRARIILKRLKNS